MANCTISTMAVNDCHLQFFDSLGNLIYEFDLESTIALNNGNGILIKDELTTLTIDKTIVVDNLELTIDELITYIQEQRVLCDCCGNTPITGEVASTLWGYDNGGVEVFIKTMSDGSEEYESPIGTAYIPDGSPVPFNKEVRNFNTVSSIVATGAGSTNAGAHRVIFTWDSGGTPIINGATQISAGASILQSKIFDATILGNGQYIGLPSIPYDASLGNIVIDELIL